MVGVRCDLDAPIEHWSSVRLGERRQRQECKRQIFRTTTFAHPALVQAAERVRAHSRQ